MIGRISMPGASIGQMKYEMPSCLGASGSVRAMRMPNLENWASDVQIFWPLTTHSSPSRTARVTRTARSEPGAGLAEQLAPDLLAGQQREQVAVLLLLGAGVEDRRAGPADADHVARAAAPRPRRSSSSMMIWWIGSASRPHGVGQCGAT